MEKTFRVTGTALATLIIRGTAFKANGYIDTLMNEKEYSAFGKFIDIDRCEEVMEAEVVKSEPVLEESKPIIDEPKNDIVTEEINDEKIVGQKEERPKEKKINEVRHTKTTSKGKNKN